VYGIQGLWSAARHQVPVTFVIANNAHYQILKAGARSLGFAAAQSERFVGMDLRKPEIDMVGLARSLGVDAITVEDPDALSSAVETNFKKRRPQLINVPIERTLAGPG
jgi:benzoylformate decarboxylase